MNKNPKNQDSSQKTKTKTPINPEAFDRPLPQSLRAERALLGSMLLGDGAIGEAITLLKGIGDEAFFDKRHSEVYRQLIRLYDASKPLDAVLFQEQLDREGKLSELGGIDFLGDLISSVPSPDRVEHYAKIVRDKYLLRRLISSTHSVLGAAFDETKAVEEILDEAENTIFNVTEHRVSDGATDLHPLIQDVFAKLDSLDGEAITGEPTGLYELDEMTCGLQPAELIIIAARPSMGKTALGLNIAEHMAITERRPVIFFSLEMSKAQLAQRLLCSRARVDAHSVRRGMLTQDDMMRLQAAADETRDAPLAVDDTSSLSVLELRARARMNYRKRPFHAIFVDYLQLMRAPGSESRQVEVAEISRGLKALAKELNVPVIALAQLNRGPTDRTNNRPRMSDLRESGAIEQDADVISLLHRESYYADHDTETHESNESELIIAKQRNGPVGTIKLHFNKQYTRFDNPQMGGGYEDVMEVAGGSPF